jgi:hypothetical protein
MNQLEFRTQLLFSLGANLDTCSELLAYDSSPAPEPIKIPPRFPLPAEPHVEAWEDYEREQAERGAFAVLRSKLVQLNFPVREGISQSEGYQRAVKTGVVDATAGDGLALERPEGLRLLIHPSLAGKIPVIITATRADFVHLMQALVHSNEPKSVPDSMGSCIVSGYNNWDRIRRLRLRWEEENADDPSPARWAAEFRLFIVPNKPLYQDTFIILSSGPYSGVPAGDVNLDEETWLARSLAIRLEHESTHYFSKRIVGVMRNNLLDELIADYCGIVSANGSYRADWFLRFMGLQNFPAYQAGGRLENYRGEPALSDGAFALLQMLVYRSALNLERYDQAHREQLDTAGVQAKFVLALSQLTLEELSSEEAEQFIQWSQERLG